MAATALPAVILLEDAVDLARILEATGRTIPRHLWAQEDLDAAAAAAREASLKGLLS